MIFDYAVATHVAGEELKVLSEHASKHTTVRESKRTAPNHSQFFPYMK